ncbi:hypothetical protein ASG52_24575 [Methylobacterium sp. Leaf456]|uniref:hypothetical protein n=1 Tax=Methylobacterium sp. Leaf456 TaxID=1736382 RepID=UPI0006F3D4EF|nr:hypothetical protein [Methylobacterium sp. Leaf456]KQT56097.1 hypothetical protein ASG52_24575 [Methylobacterium sp. Leaf456]
MTDDTVTNIVSLADRRPADIAPGSMHFRIGFRTSLSDVPGDPLPLILTMELQGQPMGEVGRFVDTAEGHRAAQAATRIGLRVVDLIAHHDMTGDTTA